MNGYCINNFKNQIDFDLNKNYCFDGFYISKPNIIKNEKFGNDVLFNDTKNFFIFLDGVILNKSKLLNGNSWIDTLYNLIVDNKYFYFDKFRGCFSGGHYDKLLKEFVVYTDFISQNPVFYYNQNGKFIVSNDYKYILDLLKFNNIKLSINENAIYNMLSYGYMFDDETYYNEIKKLSYGCYIKINSNKFDVIRYYDFFYNELSESNISENDIIENIDFLFREAVRLQFEKDIEYKFKSLCTLSGGLDSRMVLCVAKDLGYDNILCLNVSQSNYYDEIIAKKVSQAFSMELLLKNLDDGLFMLDYQNVVNMNFGLVSYAGISLLNCALKYLNFDNLGILHSGDAGDAILSTFHGSITDKYPGANSHTLVKKSKNVYNGRDNIEKYKMISRVFNGITNSMFAKSKYTYTLSPFLNREFFEFCIGKIPFHLRDNHYIYKKWILNKYKVATNIPVERYHGLKLTDPDFLVYIKKINSYGIKKIFNYILFKLGIIKKMNRKIINGSMNPYDLWYNDNNNIKSNFDNYYSEQIKIIRNNKKLKNEIIEDIDFLYHNGVTIEKMQIITVLCFLELFD